MKKSFKVTVAGKELDLAVVKPSHKASQRAQLEYSRAFREAVTPRDGQPGALLKARLERVMREQKLWDDERQAAYRGLLDRILRGEKRLKAGGGKLSELRQVCLDMAAARAEMRELLAERNELEQNTAESQAEQARFNSLVASCTVYSETGKPYFESPEDYLSREDDPAALPTAQAVGRMLYGLEDDFEKKLPENSFLLTQGLMNDALRLTDKKGNLVDSEMRPVDAKGRRVNERGEPVDYEGTPLTEEGEYKVVFTPFEDDLSAA